MSSSSTATPTNKSLLDVYIENMVNLEDDSSSKAADRFMNTLKDLFKFLKELNDYANDETGAHPVSPLLISVAASTMGAFGDGAKGKATDVFIEKAIFEKNMIFGRDVQGLREKAFMLFEDIPRAVVETVTKLLDNSLIPDESIGDVFGFVESLFKISLRREILKVAEGRSDKLVVTKEQIEGCLDIF
jgi:hypothetical protein